MGGTDNPVCLCFTSGQRISAKGEGYRVEMLATEKLFGGRFGIQAGISEFKPFSHMTLENTLSSDTRSAASDPGQEGAGPVPPSPDRGHLQLHLPWPAAGPIRNSLPAWSLSLPTINSERLPHARAALEPRARWQKKEKFMREINRGDNQMVKQVSEQYIVCSLE